MKCKVIKRIKSKTTEGLAARTDIVIVPINGEDTIQIIRTFISKKLYRDSSMHAIAKRGNLIVYTTGVAFRHSTLLELYKFLKGLIEPNDSSQ